jgi:chromate transporter
LLVHAALLVILVLGLLASMSVADVVGEVYEEQQQQRAGVDDMRRAMRKLKTKVDCCMEPITPEHKGRIEELAENLRFITPANVNEAFEMEQEFVDKRQIVTKSELLEMVAVGKSAPGIMITNISLLFGYHVAGVFGGLCAVFGIITPAVIILSIVTLFYNSFKDNYWVHAGLTGLRAAVVPIIGSAALSLGKDALRTPPAVVICLAAFCLSLFAGVSNILLVLLGVAGAMLWWGSTLVKKERVPEA